MNKNLLNNFADLPSVDTVGDDEPELWNSVEDIITNIIAVLGIACVIVMIVGGVQYMSSAGDTAKVEKGKKTILYGLIGLIICVLSFTIVNFVIRQTPAEVVKDNGKVVLVNNDKEQCEANSDYKWVPYKDKNGKTTGGLCSYTSNVCKANGGEMLDATYKTGQKGYTKSRCNLNAK